MAGTISGGKLAAETNKKKYGKRFYAVIGTKGGVKRVPKGFSLVLCDCDYSPHEHKKAQCAGAKGGRTSRRTKKVQ